MTKKSALEQALLEHDEILKGVALNAKEMLYDQIKPAIDQNIAEAIDMDTDDDKDKEGEIAPAIGDGDPSDSPIEEPSAEETPAEVSIDTDTPPTGEPSIDGEPAVEVPATDEPASDDDTMDLTGASDDELISVWKKLGDNAEIEVVKNEDGTVSVNKDGEEFLIKINENDQQIEEEFALFEAKFGKPSGGYDFMDSGADLDDDDDDNYSFLDKKDDKYDLLKGIKAAPKPADLEGDDDKIFEIVMTTNEEVEGDIPAPADMESASQTEEPLEEVARTHSDGRRMLRKPEGFYKYAESRLRPAINESEIAKDDKVIITEAETLKNENAQLITENETLKGDLDKYKDALRLMKENLENVALFNSKLAYVNKIFCEHATTTEEKRMILERFDAEEVNNPKEVKSLYKTISSEMGQTITIKESIEDKISSSTTINSTGEPLLESANPEKSKLNESLERVKAIMNYKPNGK